MAMAAATPLLSPRPHLRLRPPHPPTPSSRLSRLPAFSYRSSSNGVPDTECPVPLDQQPVREYQSLSTSVPFSWAAADLPRYCSRLVLTGAAFALLIGLPVASFGARIAGGDPHAEVFLCAIGAVSTGLLAVTFAVLRMYLGWAYVGNRLLSATVEYEETGWYDGQIWVKTPEVLARDRLLGSFSVKPVLNRVKLTLVGLAVSLVACGILYISVDRQKSSSLPEESGGRAVVGVYSEASARSFEPDAFAGNPSQSET